MKDASNTNSHIVRHSIPVEEVECCGGCKFFENEDTYGFGYCRRFDTADVMCSDEACKLYEEDLE